MAASPSAVRAGLAALSAAAVAEILPLVQQGNASAARSMLLDVSPVVTAAFVEGSTALAVDWYEELRDAANPSARHLTIVPEWQRAEKYGQAVAWATSPLLDDPVPLTEVQRRLSLVTEHEVFQGFTDATEVNVRADAAARGWRRNARSDACSFCRMLADRGAVYRKEATANFAAHTGGPSGGGNCRCTVIPVFKGGDEGPEASVLQYTASKRRTSPAERQRVYAYLRANYGAT